MSGLFRRFRRPKPKKDEEEPVEEPESAGEDSDIYPPQGPEPGGDPDIVGEPTPSPAGPPEETESVPGPPVLPEEVGPAPAPERSAPAAPEIVPPAPPAAPEGPSPAPTAVPVSRPPLPEADVDSGRAVHRPLSPPTRCFLCGTEMAGSYCPTCRMTWND